MRSQRQEFEFRRGVFEEMLAHKGMGYRRTSDTRTGDEQAALYERGRSVPGLRVTNARRGESAHEYGCATDYVPVLHGILTYRVGGAWWAEFGRLATDAGLQWGGSWKRGKDACHVELPRWRGAKL